MQYLIDTILLLPIEKVLFPFQTLTLCLSKKSDWQTALSCQQQKRTFGLVMKTGAVLQSVGCLASVEKVPIARSNGTLDIVVWGTRRFIIRKLRGEKARVRFIRDYPTLRNKRLQMQAEETRQIFLKEWEVFSPFNRIFIASMQPSVLSFFIAGTSHFTLKEQQELLEIKCTYQRLVKEAEILSQDINRRQKIIELSAWVPHAKELAYLLN